jgi:hypothetical protein
MAEKHVTLRRFLWLDEAELASAVLRGSGVECWIGDRYFLSWYPYLSVALGGVTLQVSESQAGNARDILRGALQEEEVRCPNCDSGNVIMGMRCGWFMFGVYLTILVIVPLLVLLAWTLAGVSFRRLRTRWRCDDCGFRWKSR